jgi:hypothetical protein
MHDFARPHGKLSYFAFHIMLSHKKLLVELKDIAGFAD